jgi:hypothetical protein
MFEWSQIQAIADRLAGQERGIIRPRDLDEPWRAIFGRVERLDDLSMAERVLWKATEGLPERNHLVEVILAALPAAGPGFPSLEELGQTLPAVEWLWPGWIPQGMISLLGAPPGAGKSLLALDLARRIIHGTPMPCAGPEEGDGDRDACFHPGNVVYVDAEAVPQIQNQRAVDWGMDRSRLYPLLPPDAYGMIDFGQDAHRQHLQRMVYDLAPELVVVDSLSSITLKGENSVEEVRAVLGFLANVAREFDVGLLLIHHLRKRGNSLPQAGVPEAISPDDFRGSSHIVAIARSVLALSVVQVGPVPDPNGPRRLEVVKANLCRHPPPLGMVLRDTGNGVPVLEYTAPPRAYRPPTKADACAEWLLDLLCEAGEPLKPGAVVELAWEEGFKRGVVYRARRQLEGAVVDTDTKYSPNNRWALA